MSIYARPLKGAVSASKLYQKKGYAYAEIEGLKIAKTCKTSKQRQIDRYLFLTKTHKLAKI